MKKYKITIITVTKNSEKYLKKNINSVLKQKYKNYEHILVDGNSTDNTVEIIRSYKKKVRLIKNRNDKGLYHAMNVGIKKAKGRYIALLHADDLFYSNNIISDICKKLSKYNPDVLYGNIIYVNKNHRYIN